MLDLILMDIIIYNLRCSGLWRNETIRPVLKHGPRSLTCVQVLGWQTQMRNESK